MPAIDFIEEDKIDFQPDPVLNYKPNPLEEAQLKSIAAGTGIDPGMQPGTEFTVATGGTPSLIPFRLAGEALAKGRRALGIPDIKLPRVSGEGALSGAANLGIGTVEGLIQPENLALLPLFGTGGGAGKLAATLFGAQQAAALPDQIQNAIRVLDDPDSTKAQKVEAVGLKSILSSSMIDRSRLQPIPKTAGFEEGRAIISPEDRMLKKPSGMIDFIPEQELSREQVAAAGVPTDFEQGKAHSVDLAKAQEAAPPTAPIQDVRPAIKLVPEEPGKPAEVVTGEKGETHPDIIKREGLTADQIDKREFVKEPPTTSVEGENLDAAVGRKAIAQRRLTTTSQPHDFEVTLTAVTEKRSRTGKRMLEFSWDDGLSIGVQVEGGISGDLSYEEAYREALKRRDARDKPPTTPVEAPAETPAVPPKETPTPSEPTPPVAKEPWQMTKGEYLDWLKQKYPSGELDDGRKVTPELAEELQRASLSVVTKGPKSQRRSVPPEVLADYPELKPPVAKVPTSEGVPSLEKVKVGDVDIPAQGVLNQARELKSNTWKRVQRLRSQIKELGPKAGGLRLELLKAESAHREAIQMERGALEAIEKRANELGQTTKPTPSPAKISQEVQKVARTEGQAKAVSDYWQSKSGAYKETQLGLGAGGATGKALGGTFKEINERQAAKKATRFAGLSEKASRGTLTESESKEIEAAHKRLPKESRYTPAQQSMADPGTPSAAQGPGMVGMGGALLGEVATGAGADIHGIAERVRQERALAGQTGAVEPGEGISAPDSVERGRQLISQGASPEKALSQFEQTKRFSADDMAVVRAHGEQLARNARRIEEKFGTESPEYLSAWRTLADWDRRTKPMQTEWHKAGQAQQGETDIDTGTFTGLQQAYHDATGKEFNPKQAKEAKQQSSMVSKAEAEEAAANQKAVETLSKAKADMPPAVKSLHERISKVLDSAATSALARIKARRAEGRLFAAGVDPEQLTDYAIYGASKIAKGALDFARWSKEMVADIGDYITPHLKQIWDLSNKHLDDTIDKAVPEKLRAKTKDSIRAKTPEAQVWKKVKDYIEQKLGLDDIRAKVATDLGMSVEEVTRIMARNQRVREVTADAYVKQQRARQAKARAKMWLKTLDMPSYERVARKVPGLFFTLATGFHGTVALGTHAPALGFDPRYTDLYLNNFKRMYQMVGLPTAKGQAKATALHEQLMQDLVRRKNYNVARQGGLQNDPFQHEEYSVDPLSSPSPIATFFNRVAAMGNRGYSVLKLLRQDVFDRDWEKYPETVRTKEVAKAVSDDINHVTGATKKKGGPVASTLLFAPSLKGSQFMYLFGDPVRAAKTGLNWKNATEAERQFAIRQMKGKFTIFATYMGLLGLNQAILKASGSKQKVNITDPTKSDWLKFKGYGDNLAYGSSLLHMARLPAELFADVKDKRDVEKIRKTAVDYARSQLSPFAGTVVDVGSGRDFMERPLPRAAFGLLPGKPTPAYLRKEGVKPYTWGEYSLETALPIPFKEAAKETFKAMGMKDYQADQAIKALIVMSLQAGTGARVSTDYRAK